MRWGWLVMLAATMSCVAMAADEPTSSSMLSCLQESPSNPACVPSHADLKKAKDAFSKALHLEKEKQLDEAYHEFDTAARLVPNNIDYQTALAVTREELVSQHLKQGNQDLEGGLPIQAQAEFGRAMALDPENPFAQQRMQDSLGEWAPEKKTGVTIVDAAGPAQVTPKEGLNDFHLRGDTKTILTQVAQTYGIGVEIDPSVVSRHVHFYVDKVDFYTAMRAACDVAGCFWTAVSDRQIFIVKDTQENRRLYERMALRTFDLGFVSSGPQVQEVVNLLRIIFEIRFVTTALQNFRVTVRAPVEILDAATQFLENFGADRPQVVLDIKVYEVDRQLASDYGLHIPQTFNLFNIPAIALAGLGGQNLSSLVNQLISSGGINQANSSALSGLLAQLQGQQGGSSIFSNPVATFGGGLTLMGLTLDMITATLSRNESLVRMLDHATLRAGQGSDASFKLGQRYPVINASFAPIFNTSAISQVLQNGSFQAPIPSFSYEDLGLDIKAKPAITSNYNVNLQLEMQLRSLAGQSLNGVPIIASRGMKSSVNLENGEPAVVASSISLTEMKTITGVPGLGFIPGLKNLAATTTNSTEDDELLIVITPQIVSLDPPQSTEVWLSK